MAGADAFAAFLARVEGMVALNADVAREAAPAVREVFRANCEAGVAPDGSQWPPAADGGTALPGAGDAVTCEAKGTRIMARIGPPWVFHNYGAGGSSTTREAKRRRAYTARKRASAVAAGEDVTRSRFHAPRRQILPDPGDPIPEKIADVLRTTAEKVFVRGMGGR